MSVRPATLDDSTALLELMRAYYAEDAYPFVPDEARATLERLLQDATLGRVFVLLDGGQLAGYAVLTLGYSLEYRGRDAFVDELYVRPASRGRGLAKAALLALEEACQAEDVRNLHLEVERDKQEAQALYRRVGFRDSERRLMTKRLE